MADGQPQYEIKNVQAIRGTEARTIAKWQREGWEITGQVPGTLRTEISMRRPKPKLPVKTLAIAGGVAVVVVIAVVLGITFGSDGDEAAPVAETSAATATETSAPVVEEPAPSSEVAPVALTPETNADLAALLALTDYCAPEVAAFAETYKGQTLSFPASIGAMNPHDGASTRYDILMTAGDFSETSAPGPAFQFRDVNSTNDMHWVGDAEGTIGVGTNLAVTAEVVEYEASSCLLLLEPVETAVR